MTAGRSPQVRTLAYGTHPSQRTELTLPAGTPRGVIVVIHGGFWRARYDLSLGRPLAADLVRRGWATLNLEYRRIGDGGGVPATLDDVAAGIDSLADLDLDLHTVVALGHSAGGHLAAWAASQPATSAWAAPRVRVAQVIAQAGVLDLERAARDHLGRGAVFDFAGPPGAAYADLDPARLPVLAPTWCVHARDDDTVPFGYSEAYVAAATSAGAQTHLVEVDGGHYGVIDPGSPAWQRQVDVLDRLG